MDAPRPVRTALILAAGEGTRLRPVSDGSPKAALPVGDRPLIAHHLDALRSVSITDVIVVVGASGALVRGAVDRHASGSDLRIRFVTQPNRRGIADAILCAERELEGSFVVILADVYAPDHRLSDALADHAAHAGVTILGATNEPDPGRMARNYSIEQDGGGWVTRVVEKPSPGAPGLKGIGTYVFDASIFDAIRRTPPSALRGECEITDAVQTLIDSGGRVRSTIVTERDINVNDAPSLLDANAEFLRRSGTFAWIAADARVDSSAVVRGSVVASGAIIEPEAILDRCVVLEGARVASGCVHRRCVITPESVVAGDPPGAWIRESIRVARLVCPRCRGPIDGQDVRITCAACDHAYPIDRGFPDLIIGDRFPDALGEDELEAEEAHCCHTARHYWAPAFRRALEESSSRPRVLSLGCGVGAEVDVLCELGFDCVGIDNGNRTSRWARRIETHRLALASGMHLPFESASFDIVFCGCVFPHVGVVGDTYRVTPSFRDDRARLAGEIARVLRPNGVAFAASPNRLFPLDIFHGRESGSIRPRVNLPTDPFLLSVGDYARMFCAAGCHEARAHAPHGYWTFGRSARTWKGRAGAIPVRALFRAGSVPLLQGSPVTPWIVVSARKPA